MINVHVGLDTLTHVNSEHGWLDGYGPITADTARDLAADPTGTWRRLITDPATRRLLAYDVRTYTPPRAVADHVVTRAHTCTFPGCARAAYRCDLDHALSHAAGGLTAPENLHPLCRRHHRAKHHAGWHVRLHPDGATTWTSPDGRTHHTRPPDRLGPDEAEPPKPESPPDEAEPAKPESPPDDPAPF